MEIFMETHWCFDPGDELEMADALGVTPAVLVDVFDRFDLETRP